MQVIHERCAGIDVHKKTVVVCVLITHADSTVQKEKRTFTTMTEDLLALDAWLESQQVKHVAMESTGLFWHPIWNILEEGREILYSHPSTPQDGPGSQDRHHG